MQENDKPVLVYSTFPSPEAAEAVGRELVEQRLAACVNILPRVQSIYHWQGAVESATEIPLFIKSTASNYLALQQLIVELHPNQIPEIIALPIKQGLPAYLNWVAAETSL